MVEAGFGAKGKIGILLPSLNGGGAERVALFLAETLAKAGYAVDLVVAVNKGALADHPLVQRFLVDLHAPNEMLSALHIARYCRRARPDLLIAFVHSAKIMAGIARLFVRDMPLVLSVHAALDIPRKYRFWVRRFFGFGLERWLYRGVLGCHVVSKALRGQVVARFAIPEERVRVIYNPIPERGAIAPLSPEHEGWFDAPVLMTAGRMMPQKDHARMIRAFARAGLGGRAKLLILGEGPLEGDLRALAASLGLADDVIFGGFQPDVRPYMAKAQGFILSSVFEGLPLVLIEMLSAGVAVASFDCPTGPREILEEGRLGRLIAPGDTDGLATAMRDIVDGRLKAPATGDAARALAQYSPEKIANDYIDFVRECLQRAAASRPGATTAAAAL